MLQSGSAAGNHDAVRAALDAVETQIYAAIGGSKLTDRILIPALVASLERTRKDLALGVAFEFETVRRVRFVKIKLKVDRVTSAGCRHGDGCGRVFVAQCGAIKTGGPPTSGDSRLYTRRSDAIADQRGEDHQAGVPTVALIGRERGQWGIEHERPGHVGSGPDQLLHG